MAMITKSMMTTLAPILTYTMDEIVEYLPTILKDDKDSIFDFIYQPLPTVENSLDYDYMKEARDKFFESIDSLKKDKTLKSTLELVIYTDSDKFQNLDRTDAEDWFIVSKVIKHDEENELTSFTVGDNIFKVFRGDKAKCPRCWKYRAVNEETLCERCTEAVEV